MTEATASPKSRLPKNPLAERIRHTSNLITKLLQRYDEFKFGYIRFRIRYIKNGEIHLLSDAFTDLLEAESFLKKVQEENRELNFEVVQEQVPPAIKVVSDPDILLQPVEADETNEKDEVNPNEATDKVDTREKPEEVSNPLFDALIKMKELTPQQAHIQENLARIGIVRALGVDATLECSCLIKWARSLAAQFTYLLELKTVYSDEIKAKYSELLIDLNTARGIADKLIRTLGKNRGFLGVHEYSEQVGELLREATIIRKSCLQLADYHDEFTAGRGGGAPIEMGESVKWVLEGEEEKSPLRRPRPPPKEVEEGKA